MAEKLLIGNFPSGLNTNREPFFISNDSFPVLENAYAWRGRVKKKRGTDLFGRLQRRVPATSTATILTLSGAGTGSANLISDFSLQSSGSIVLGSISFTDGTHTWTDPLENGTLTGTGGATGTINYATGAITLAGGTPSVDITGSFQYYPNLPVMGLEDFDSNTQTTAPLFTPPQLVAFDTVYSYQATQGVTNTFFDVSFYKASGNPVVWSGQDYQQFWSCNYYNALWVTNSNPGLHFLPIATITVGSPTIITTTNPHGLITGDYVWFNEVTGTDAADLNGQTAQITRTGANSFTVPIDTTADVINNSGIFQTLTASAGSGDGIRWYDGNNGSPPVGTTLGWVNFAPPTSNAVQPKYLVGASVIIPFKDRLVCFGYYLQGSQDAAPIYYEDGAIWSWNGTPFYTTLVPTGVSNLLGGVPSAANAWYQTPGNGGFLLAGIQQEIITVTNNQDVLLVGFENRQTRFVYTLNDLDPFIFYAINSELGSQSQFSGVTLDQGAVTIGQYGIIITNQIQAQRIDLDIPDSVFTIRAEDQGVDRVNAYRDYRNEWIYFSYPSDNSFFKFPTETFLWNYRDNTWAILFENFTHHGQVFITASYTWGNNPYTDWGSTNVPWGSGQTGTYYPTTLGGTQQGFVLALDRDSSEAQSAYISNVVGTSTSTTITSPNHCLYTGAFVFFEDCLGITNINGVVGKVTLIIDSMTGAADPDNFLVDIQNVTGTYLGGGTYSILNQYFLQTKMFQPYWEQGKQIRIGTQKYLFDNAPQGQTTVNLYLSENPANSGNQPPYIPDPNTYNYSVFYTSTVLTSPEPIYGTSTDSNPAGTPNPSQQQQSQIWHNLNTSLIGDTVQIGFTLSDTQMKAVANGRPYIADSDFVLHAIDINISPSQVLAV